MISSSVSSIQANRSYMNANAVNVANVSSDGFAPTRTTMQESSKGGVRATFSQESIDSASKNQTDLSKELTDQISIEKSVGANVSAIKTQDDMFGSLLDIKV